jgi:ABC-2 type transport system ATP-binding protein
MLVRCSYIFGSCGYSCHGYSCSPLTTVKISNILTAENPMEKTPLLSIRNVSKTFVIRGMKSYIGLASTKRVHALRDISFDVPAGRVTALLGPNGAGKTTLINIICDLVRADAGSVHIDGLPVSGDHYDVHRLVGLTTTNERSFFWRLSGRQNLNFFAALYDLPRDVARKRMEELVERFGLEDHINRLFRFYSTGMKKRLALVRCLMHDPKVLLLDEPTNGLDPAAADDFIILVHTQIVAQGKSVIWATHRMQEVVDLCDHVIVLGEGRILFQGAVSEFKNLSKVPSGYRLEVHLPEGRDEDIISYLQSWGANMERQENNLQVMTPRDRTDLEMSAMLGKLIEFGAVIKSLEQDSLSLNNVFIKLTQGKMTTHRSTVDRQIYDE